MGQTKSKISAILWSILCETVGCHFVKTSIWIVGWFQRYLFHIQIRISKEFKTREPLNLLPRRFGAELCIGYDKPILICRIALFTFRACIEHLMTREKFEISERKVKFSEDLIYSRHLQFSRSVGFVWRIYNLGKSLRRWNFTIWDMKTISQYLIITAG